MIKIYKTTYCRFCDVVFSKCKELGLEEGIHYIVINAEEGSGKEELLELGGKMQVPFMFDEDADIKMYESFEIAMYLAKHAENIKKRKTPFN